ncbi:hypothetical protein Taro_018777 [Colocasia esculenta]|uniref:Uncharacterized protein n=1 Tax=Colocasia esculenta TaxID=4460 RepID=A0A843V045_COLES|nr:hypothetical protein [Colocasia esculenta]
MLQEREASIVFFFTGSTFTPAIGPCHRTCVTVTVVLLDFIRQINDDQGPMEEQRQRYGPFLYSLTKMLIWIRNAKSGSDPGESSLYMRINLSGLVTQVTVVKGAVGVHGGHFFGSQEGGEVFANSPFLISAEEAGAVEARKTDDFKETIIPAGKIHEIEAFILTRTLVSAMVGACVKVKDGLSLTHLQYADDTILFSEEGGQYHAMARLLLVVLEEVTSLKGPFTADWLYIIQRAHSFGMVVRTNAEIDMTFLGTGLPSARKEVWS